MTRVTVIAERVLSPMVSGKMLSRGYTVDLFPELYAGHRDLLTKLKRSRAWRIEEAPVEQPEPVEEVVLSHVPSEKPLYAHQAALVERLRARSSS